MKLNEIKRKRNQKDQDSVMPIYDDPNNNKYLQLSRNIFLPPPAQNKPFVKN